MTQFRPVYDLHCHVGPHGTYAFADSGPGHLVRQMDRVGIALGLVSHTSAIWAPSRGNADTIAVVKAHPDHFRGLCVAYPQYPELTAQILRDYEAGAKIFAGFKLHPLYHKYPLSEKGYEEVLEFANERGLIVLVHTWGNGHVIDETERTRRILSLCGPEQVRRVVARYPRIKWLAGHSFNGHWVEAVQLALDFPNLYLETSTVNDRGVIEMFCERAGSRRVVFGSDYPFVGVRYGVGCVLTADITDDDRRNILQTNAERLLAGVLPDGGVTWDTPQAESE